MLSRRRLYETVFLWGVATFICLFDILYLYPAARRKLAAFYVHFLIILSPTGVTVAAHELPYRPSGASFSPPPKYPPWPHLFVRTCFSFTDPGHNRIEDCEYRKISR